MTDIFATGAAVLVCPVNTVGVMGAGLAKAFAQRWPAFEASYKAKCRQGTFGIGQLHVWKDQGSPTLIALPTKVHWSSSSRIFIVERGLDALAAWLEKTPPSSIAVPALGCGLGGLKWADVGPLTERALAGAQRAGWTITLSPPGGYWTRP